MFTALLRAPVANVCTQLAYLPNEWTVTGNRISAQTTDRRALYATGRTVVLALFAGHMRKTIAAFGGAEVASLDVVLGILIQMVTHGIFPLIKIG